MLAEVTGDSTKKNSSMTHVKDVPTFELRTTQDCNFTLIVGGLTGVAVDLSVIVTDSSEETLVDIPIGKEGDCRVSVKLQHHKSPFRLVLDSEDEEVLNTIDVDFECDAKFDYDLLQ